MYTKQMGQENTAMFAAARVELDRLDYSVDGDQQKFLQDAIATLQPQFPDVSPARLRHQINRVMAQRRGEAWRNRAGAPDGNANAVRKDGKPRVFLNVRVEQSTLEWLEEMANKSTGGNVGRWLDYLSQK